jgi:Skp family chaperone for outer membrane proteins
MNISINSISGNNTGLQPYGLKLDQGLDSVGKNLQSRIANAQKQIQNLGDNEDMSPEEKMKKRQEIQKQISDLQNQLRQHQIEQRMQDRQRRASMDDMLGGRRQSGNNTGSNTGLSDASMQAIISADAAMSQTKVQGAVKSQMEGQAHVLKGEIKMEESRGGNAEKLKEKLAELEAKVQDLTSSQMEKLSDITQETNESAKAYKADNVGERGESGSVEGVPKESTADTGMTEPVGGNVDIKL